MQPSAKSFNTKLNFRPAFCCSLVAIRSLSKYTVLHLCLEMSHLIILSGCVCKKGHSERKYCVGLKPVKTCNHKQAEAM